MSFRSQIAVTFFFFLISISSATVSLSTDLKGINTDAPISTSPKRDVLEVEMDWRRGGVGLLAYRLQEQLAVPPLEGEDSKRAKRDRPFYSADHGPNNYRDGPDFLPGPSPAPGIGLDSRIIESNDGRYHGHALKYHGAAADIMATTPFSIAKPNIFQSTNNESRDDLKMLQGRFNRWRLAQASVTLPRITTPAIAWIQDPNYESVNAIPEPEFAGSRRMLDPGNKMPKPYIPPIKMLQLDPHYIIPARPVLQPFIYEPNARPSSFRPPVTPDVQNLSPLELFKRLYMNTTKQRIRTRKPRPKKPIRIQPMKDDEYIPEESEVDVTTSVIQTYKLDEKDTDEDRKITHIASYISGDEGPVTILNVPEERTRYEKKLKSFRTEEPDLQKAKLMDVKQFIDHVNSLASVIKKEPTKSTNYFENLPEFKKTYAKNIPDDQKSVQESEPNESIGKIKMAQAVPVIELPGDEEFQLSEIKKPFEKLEIKKIDKELLKDLVSYKALENIPKIEKQDYKEKHFKNLPKLEKETEKPVIDNHSGSAFKELMAVPLLQLKSGRDDKEMNEQLKALLMPEDDPYDPKKSLMKSNNADYVEIKPEEIKGIPIRRRRRIKKYIML